MKKKSAQTTLRPDGRFGRWFTDEYGLPAYEYTCDQANDHRAAAFTTAGPSDLHWHNIGNDSIGAIATNRGEIQVYESSRGLQWLNYFAPARHCPGAGIACIIEKDRSAWTDLYEPGAPSRGYRRVFGSGYFKKIKEHDRLTIVHTITIPYGTDPVVVSGITLTNNSGRNRSLEVLDFFGINIHCLSVAPVYTHAGRKHFSPGTVENTLANSLQKIAGNATDSIEMRNRFADKFRFKTARPENNLVVVTPVFKGRTRPPQDKASAWNYYPYPFFAASSGSPSHAMIAEPKQVVDLNGEFIYKWGDSDKRISSGTKNKACLCNINKCELTPGERIELRSFFGYARAEDIGNLVSKYKNEKPEPQTSTAGWGAFCPSIELPDPDCAVIDRETKWHAYYTRSSCLYDSYYDCNFAPQGGVYEFLHGFRGAIRDFGLFVMGLTYLSPRLARGTLELCFRMMTPTGRLMYGAYGFGKTTGALVHENPSDLQLFLFLGLAEYIYFTGDYEFLDHRVRLCSKERKTATIRECVNLAIDYFYNTIGLGEHGLVRVGDGDWSDGISLFVRNRRKFVKKGESVFNSAMALYVLPHMAGIVESWSARRAEEMRSFADGLEKSILEKTFNGKWFYRGFDGTGRPIGDSRIFLEHHAWLLISRVLPEDTARNVIAHVYEELDRRAQFGQYILYPPVRTSMDHFARGWDVNGGIWFAMNFLITWGYGLYDPEKGWNSLKKNSMAMKATIDPDLWYGIWSGPDSFNAYYADRPGETFYHLPTPCTDFPVMNLNLHALFIAGLVKLAGVEPCKDGVHVNPLLPFDNFRLEMPAFSIHKQHGKTSFRLRSCEQTTNENFVRYYR